MSATRSGMSLMEVMVASAVLATAVFAGFGAMGNAHMMNQRRLLTDRAQALLVNEIEIYQAMDQTTMDDVFSGTSTVPFGSTDRSAVTTNETGNGLDGTVTLVERIAGSARPRSTLLFRVDWTDGQGPAWVQAHFHYTERQ